MNTAIRHQVSIEADETVPVIRITRDFGYAKLDAILGDL